MNTETLQINKIETALEAALADMRGFYRQSGSQFDRMNLINLEGKINEIRNDAMHLRIDMTTKGKALDVERQAMEGIWNAA